MAPTPNNKRSHRGFSRALLLLAAGLSTSTPARSATLTWYGDGANLGGSGTWDNSSFEWTYDGGATFIAWLNNTAPADDAVFDGAGGTVTLGVPITAGTVTFNTDGYTLTGSTLTLLGGITASDASAAINSAITLGAANTWTVGSGKTLTVGGAITNGGFGLTLAGAGNTTINGAISGTGTLTKTGAGTVTLSTANTYSGTTTITGGTLKASHASALGGTGAANGGAVFIKGGTLELAFNSSTGSYGSSTTNFAIRTGNITMGGLSGATSTLASSGVISGNPVGFSLGSGFGNTLTYDATNNGGTATISAYWAAVGTSNAGNTTITVGDSTATNVELDFTGRISNTGQADGRNLTMVKAGAGAMRISAANFLPGVQVDAGTLIVNHASALGSSRASDGGIVNLVTVKGGTLDLNGFSNTIGGLSDGAASAGVILNNAATASTLSVGSSNATNTFSGLIKNGTSTVALVKQGTGTLTLSGANTFTGGATVDGGELRATNAAGFGTGAVTVGAAGTAGINGNLTVTNNFVVANGGTLRTADSGSSNSTTLSGVISGAGLINLAGNGDTSDTGGNLGGGVYLTGTNTFTGPLAITSGVLDTTANFGNASVIILNGGGLVDRNNNTNISRAIEVGSSGILRRYGSANNSILSGTFSTYRTTGQSAVRVTDGGVQKLTGSGAGYLGSIYVARGTLEVTAADWSRASFVQDNTSATTSALTFNGGATTTISSLVKVDKDIIVNAGTTLDVLQGIYWTTTAGSWLKNSTTAGSLTSSSGVLTVANGAFTGNITTGDQQINTLVIKDASTAQRTSLVKRNQNNLILAGSNTYTGGTSILGGQLTFSSGALASTGFVTIGQGGALVATGASADIGAWLSGGRISAGSTGALLVNAATSTAASTVGYNNLWIGTTGAFTYSGALTVGASGFRFGSLANTNTLTVSSALTGSSALTLRGLTTGGLTLTAANTYSGGTTVNGGVLTLNFSSIAGTDNILQSGSRVTLNGSQLWGGTLALVGKAATVNNQTLGNLTLAAGSTSTLTSTIGAGGTVNLTLSSVTRNLGGILSITRPATGNITLTGGAAGLITSSTGAAYATLGTTDWAALDASANVVAATYTTFGTAGTVTLTGNADLTAGTAGTYTLGANSSPSSIRINSAAHTLALGGFTLATSGILTNRAINISGTGSLTPSIAGGELVFNASANGTISSAIANNGGLASSFTKAGTGTLTLSGANTLSGTITIANGAVIASSAGALGTATVTVGAGSALRLGATVTGSGAITLRDGAMLYVQGGSNSLSRNIVLDSVNSRAFIGGFYTGNAAIINSTISGRGDVLIGAWDVQQNQGSFVTGWKTNSYIGQTYVTGGSTYTYTLGTPSNGDVYTPFGASTNAAALLYGSTTSFSASSTPNNWYLDNAVALDATGAYGSGNVILAFNDANARLRKGLTVQQAGTSTATLQLSWSNKHVYLDSALSGSGILRLTASSGTGSTLYLNAEGSFSGVLSLDQSTYAPYLYLGQNRAAQNAVVSLTGAATRLGVNTDLALIGGLSGVSSSDVSAVGTSLRSLTVNTNANSTFAGTIGANGSNLSLVKTGTGTLALGGTNTYVGSTAVQGGTLTLDFNVPGAPTSNILLSTSTVSLAGGATLSLNGAGSATNAQTLAALELSGRNTVSLAANVGGSVTLNTGVIRRTNGGSVNFSTTPSASNVVNLTGYSTGLVGGWATIGSGTSETYAAVNASGNLALASTAVYTSPTTTALLTGATVTQWHNNGGVGTAGSYSYQTDTLGTVAGTVSLNLLRTNNTTAQTLSLGDTLGWNLTLNGLLNAGTAGVTIQRGTAANNIVIGSTRELQIAGSQAVTLSAPIVDNAGGASSVIYSGTGTLTLTGLNTFSGNIVANSGTLVVGTSGGVFNNNYIGAGAIVNRGATLRFTGDTNTNINSVITVNGGGTLEFGSAYTVGGGNTAYIGTLNLSSDNGAAANVTGVGAFRTGYNGNTTINSTGLVANTISAAIQMPYAVNRTFTINTAEGNTLNISGVMHDYTALAGQVITKSGTGTLVLLNAGNSFTGGGLAINAGTLQIGVGGRLNSGSYGGTIAVGSGATFAYDSTASQTLSGVISGAGNIVKSGSGALTLSGNNTFTGSLTVSQGTTTIDAAANTVWVFSGSGININGASTLVVNSTGAGRYDFGGKTFTFDSVGGGTLNYNGDGNHVFAANNTYRTLGGARNTIGGTGTINVNGNTAVFDVTRGTDAWADLVLATSIWNTTSKLTKTGSGIMALTAAQTYGGATTLNAGTLLIDFNQTGATASNILSTSSSLVLGGGDLSLVGKLGTVNAQTVNGLTVNAGGGNLRLDRNLGTSLALTVGAITRNVGGTLNIVQTDTPSATNGVITTSSNTNGILGGYATVNGADWAVANAASGITAYTGYTNDTWAAGNNVNVVTMATAPTSASTANSLRFSTAGAATVTLAGANTLTSGGILVTSSVGANTTTITGGTLTSSASSDIVVHQHNTLGGLNIASDIVNNTSTGFTKTGAGTVTLTGDKSFTGAVNVIAGTLVAAGTNSNFGSIGKASTITVYSGATLQTGGSDNGLAGNANAAWTMTLNNGATLYNSTGNTYHLQAITLNGGTIFSTTSNATYATWSLDKAITTGGLGTTSYITGGNLLLNQTSGTIFNIGTGDTLVIGANIGNHSAATTPTGLTKQGTGTLILSATAANIVNPAFGTKAIEVQNGSLVLASGASNRLGSAASVTLGAGSNSGKLVLGDANGAGSQAINTLAISGTGTANAIVGGSSAISTLTLGQTAIATYAGKIGGTGTFENNLAVTYSGTAALTLSGANTYIGGTTITGSGSITYGASNVLADTGAVTITAGSLALGANNDTIGALTLTGGGITGTGTLTPSSMRVSNASGTISIAANLAGTGGLYKEGAGALTLAGTNTYTGTTTVAAGTLTLSASAAFSGSIVNAGTVTASSTSLQGVTNTAGTFTANSATSLGPVTVSGGTLSATSATTVGNLTLSGGTLTLGSAATAASLNKTGGTLVLASAGTAGTLTLTNASVVGGNLNFDLSNVTNSGNDLIVGNSTVSLAGLGTVTVNTLNGYLAAGSYNLVTSTGLSNVGALTLAGQPAGTRQTYALSTSTVANTLTLDVGAGASLVYANGTGVTGSGASTSTWSTSASDAVWSNSGAADIFYQADSVTFDDSLVTGAQTVSLVGALTPSAIIVSGALDYTIGGSGSLSGGASITKNGTGTLRLQNSGANTLSGTITVNGGKLAVTSAYAMSTGGLFLNDGATFAAVANKTISRNLAVSGAVALGDAVDTGTLTFTGASTFATGASLTSNVATAFNTGTTTLGTSLTLAGAGASSFGSNIALAGNTTLTVTGAGGATFSGVLSSANVLTKEGDGKLTLTGANTYSGGTTINAGTLQVGAAGATGALSSTGTVTVASGATLAFYRNDTGQVGVASNIAGAGTVSTLGTGTQNQSNYGFTGTNTSFTGNWSIGAGSRGAFGSQNAMGATSATVTVAATGQLYLNAGTTYANNLTIAGAGWNETTGYLGAIRYTGSTTTGTITLSGNATIVAYNSTGTINGAIGESAVGSALSYGAAGMALVGTLNVNGTNTYTGGTNLLGAVTVNANSSGAFGTGLVTVGGDSAKASILVLANGVSLTNALTLNANAGNASGVVQLSGSNSATISGLVTLGAAAPTTGNFFGLGSGTLSLTGGVTSSNGITFGAGNYVFAAGASAYSLRAGGAVAFGNGTTSFTGDIRNAGNLTLGAGNSTIVGNVDLGNAGALSLANSGALTFGAGNISVTGDITASSVTLGAGVSSLTGAINANSVGLGAGTFTLGGSGSYQTLALASGTLRLGAADALRGSSSGLAATITLGDTAASTATLDLNGYSQSNAVTLATGAGSTLNVVNASATTSTLALANDGSIGANFSGNVALNLSGASAKSLVGTNSHTGGTTVSGGALTVGSIYAVGTGALALNGAALNVTQSTAATFAAALTGDGALNKSGAGVLTLSNAGGFTGAINISAGGLVVTATTLAGTGDIAVGGNPAVAASLSGGFSTGRNITVYDGSALRAGTGLTAGTLTTTGVLTLATSQLFTSGSEVSQLNVLIGTSASDLIDVSQGVLQVDGTVNVSFINGGFSSGRHDFLVYDLNNAVFGNPLNPFVKTGSYGRTVISDVQQEEDLGTGLGYFYVNVENATMRWVGNLSADLNATEANFVYGAANTADTVQASDNLLFDDTSSVRTVNLQSGLPDLAKVTVNTDAGYTIGGAGGFTGAGAQFVKTGTGTLVLGGTNTFGGGMRIESGTVAVASDAALGAASGSITLSTGATLRATDDFTLGSARALTLEGDGTLSVDDTKTLTYAGAIAGAHALTKAGNGVLVLSGANLYTGDTTVSAGTLRVSGTIGISGSYAAAIDASGTMEFASASDQTVSGVISGSGALLMSGTGKLVLQGANTFTGVTTISAGTLEVGNAAALGAAGASLALNGGKLSSSSTTAYTLTAAGNSSIGGNLTLGDATNSGALTLTNAFDFGGANRTLTIASDVTLSGALSNGGLTKAGTGTLTLSGSSSYTGGTTVNAGTLAVAADDALGAAPGSATPGQLTLNGGTLSATQGFTLSANRGLALGASGGTVQVASGQTLSYAGIAAGAGRLTKTGAGTLTLSGANTYSGGTTISAGTLIGNATSLQGAITNNATLVFNQTGSGTYSGVISGTGAISSTGTGTLTLGAVSTFTGTVNVSGGVLKQGIASALGSISSLTVQSGGSFDANGLAGLSGKSITIAGTGAAGATGVAAAALFNSNATTGVALGNITLSGDATIGLAGGSNSSSNNGGTINLGGFTLTINGANNAGYFYGAANPFNNGTVVLTNGAVFNGSAGMSTTGGVGNLNVTGGSYLALRDFNNGGATNLINITLDNGYISSGPYTYSSGNNNGGGGGLNNLINPITVAAGGGTFYSNNTAFLINITHAGTLSGSGALSVIGGRGLVLKGDTSGYTGTLTLSTASNTLSFNPNAASQTFNGVISGAAALSKDGSNTTILASANTAFTGATSVNLGTLRLANANALSASAVTLNGGSLAFDSSVSATFNLAGLTAAAGNNIALQNNAATPAGITLSVGSNSASTAIGGVLSGAGALVKVGSGNLTLSGANTYSGGTTLSAGGILVGSNTALGSGTVALNGGTVASNSSTARSVANNLTIGANMILGDATNNGVLTFSGTVNLGGQTRTLTVASTTTLSGVISSGGLIKAGSGALTLSGLNSYTGGTTIQAGSVTLGNSNVLASTGDVTLTGGSTLAMAAFNNTVGLVTLTSGSITGTGTLTGSSYVADGGVGTTSSASVVLAGSGGLAKSGAGTLNLTGSNTFSGKVTVTGGQLNVATDAGFGAAPGAAVADQITLNGGTIGFSAGGQTLNANRGITLGASGGTLDTSVLGLTGTSTFASVISGTGALTLKGSGNTTFNGGSDGGLGIRLTAANTFVGNVTLSSGLVSYTSDAAFGDASNSIILSGGGLLDAGANIALARNIQASAATTSVIRLYGAAAATWSGAFTGTGTINRTDGGTLTLSGNLSGFGGTFSLLNSGANLTLTGTTPGAIGGAYTMAAGAWFTVNSSANQSIAGVISGAGALAKSGSGILTLSGTNSYSGGTNISGGTVVAGSSANIGSGSITIGSGTSLQLTTSATAVTNTFNAGAGTLKLILTGASGDSSIANLSAFTGTLQLSNLSSVGDKYTATTANNYAAGADLLVDSGSTFFADATAGTFKSITLSGSGNSENRGALRLGATVTATNGITLMGDTTLGGQGGGLAGGALTSGAAGTQTLTLGTANSTGGATIANAIGGGTGTINLSVLTGTYTLSGVNTYTGTTSIASGATLALTSASNQTLAGAVSGSAGTLNKSGAGVLTFSSTASLGTVNLSGGGLTIAGAATLGTVNLTGGALSTGASSTASATLSASSGTNSLGGTLAITTSGGSYGINITNGATLNLVNGSNISSNSRLSITGGTFSMAAGSSLSIDSIRTTDNYGTPTSSVTHSGGTLTITGNTNNTSTSDSFLISHWAGTTNWTMSGGTLNATAANLLFGWDGTPYMTISGGTANLRGINFNSGYNNTGSLTLSGGRLNLGVAGLFNTASNKTLTFGASAGTATVGAFADWSAAPEIALTGSTTFDTLDSVDGATGRTITLNGRLSGSGNLIKVNAGTLTLAATNTFTGAVSATGGTINVNGLNQGVASFAASGSGTTINFNFTNFFAAGHGAAVASNRSLSASAGAALVFASGTQARLGNINLDGGTFTSNRGLGSFDMLLANLASGSAATVTVGSANGAASLMNGSGGLHLQGVQNFAVADATGNASADLVVSLQLDNGGVSGGAAGGINKTGQGTMSLTHADNSFTGDITIGAGTLHIGGAGRLGGGSYAGTITNNGVLSLSTSANQTLSGGMSGTGSLNKAGTATLTLSGTNSYSGGTTVSAGTLAFANDSLGSAGAIQVDGGALRWSTGNTQNISARLSGGASGATLDTNANNVTLDSGMTFAGNLTKAGAGSLTLTGTSTVGGATAVTGGSLILGVSNALGNSAFSVGSGATLGLGFALAENTTFGNAFTGAGTVDLATSGAYNLVLSGLSGFGGTIKLSTGVFDAVTSQWTGKIVFAGGSLAGTLANNHTGEVVVGTGSTINATDGIPSNVTLSGGTLNLGGLVNNSANITFGGGELQGAQNFTGSVTIAQGGTVNLASGSVGAAKVVVQSGSSVSLTGTVTNAIEFTGGTITNGQNIAGDLIVSGNQSLAVGTHIDAIGSSAKVKVQGGTVDLAGSNTSATIDYTTGALTNAQNFAGNLNVKTGATLTNTTTQTLGGNLNVESAAKLQNAGTVSGAVTVDGTLTNNGVVSGAVTVKDGGTLAGSGLFASATIQAGGDLSPGNSPGVQSFSGTLTLQGGATWTQQFYSDEAVITSGAYLNQRGYDTIQIANTGTLDLSAASVNNKITLKLVTLTGYDDIVGGVPAAGNFDYTWNPTLNGGAGGWNPKDFVIASYTGSAVLGAGISNITSVIAFDTTDFYFSGNLAKGYDSFTIFEHVNGGTGLTELTLRIVPEPSTYGMILGGLALAAAAIRRRKARKA